MTFTENSKFHNMVSEQDILRTAQATIRKCGKKYDPLDYALNQAERLYANGDVEGAATWMRVVNAIGVILSTKPDTLH